MSITLALLCATNILILALLIIAGLKIKRLIDAGKAFITPVDDKTPSALAQTTQAVADQFGRSVTAQLCGSRSKSDRG
jgi:hypothetical protein